MHSINNPINTEIQRSHELYALEIFNDSALKKEREKIRAYWLDLVNPTEVMFSCFETAFEEVMFGAVIWALNQNPLNPKVITISRIPHFNNERSIPGSRWGIDNPDSIYRVIPVDAKQSYMITGQIGRQQFNENHFTLWDSNMKTIGLISGQDLETDKDGFFEISVDSTPAKGRKNHIQTKSDAKEFYIRDVMTDWLNDRPNILNIKLLDHGRGEDKTTKRDELEICKRYMKKWATNTTRWNQQALSKPTNEFSFKIDRDTDGALRNQIYVLGHFSLPSEDHCILLQISLSGANYFIAPITNIWGTTNNIVNRNGSLNNNQAKSNVDGTYTFILSLKDPGIYNWLDPCDMSEGILTLRWSGFEGNVRESDTYAQSQTLLLSDAKNLISPHLYVTSTERKKQLAIRSSSHEWRLSEEAF